MKQHIFPALAIVVLIASFVELGIMTAQAQMANPLNQTPELHAVMTSSILQSLRLLAGILAVLSFSQRRTGLGIGLAVFGAALTVMEHLTLTDILSALEASDMWYYKMVVVLYSGTVLEILIALYYTGLRTDYPATEAIQISGQSARVKELNETAESPEKTGNATDALPETDALLSGKSSHQKEHLRVPRCKNCEKLLRGMRKDAQFCSRKCGREYRKQQAALTE